MIQLAKLKEAQQLQAPKYRAGIANIKQEPNYVDKMKMAVADKAAGALANKAESMATPYLEAGMSKLGGMFSGSSAPAATELASNLAAQGVAPASYMGGTTATGAGIGSLTGAAGSGAAGAGMMAGLGAAVPYIGAGLLAGKALGFFNDGGYVGPLYAAQGNKAEKNEDFLDSIARKIKSAKNYVMGEDREGSKAESFLKGEGVSYNAEGGYLQGPLAIRKIRYKQDGGKIEVEATMGE